MVVLLWSCLPMNEIAATFEARGHGLIAVRIPSQAAVVMLTQVICCLH
ncbi:MAG: hypothetical protein ACD_39C00623G0001 [uncultured bacterium]|nr:MAG: hypothetical protein ACD_39C00623G0001 [uncultured bacterium]